MANDWVEHVRQYAREHNMSYREAMKDAKQSYGGNEGGQSAGFVKRLIAEGKFDIKKMKNPSQDLIDTYGTKQKSKKDELTNIKNNLASYKKEYQSMFNETDKKLNELKSKKGITKVTKEKLVERELVLREEQIKALKQKYPTLLPYLKKYKNDLNEVLKAINQEINKN